MYAERSLFYAKAMRKKKKHHLAEEIVASPAIAVEKTVAATEHAAQTLKRPANRLGKFWHVLGPGLTTGAADDDPSGIATYSQTGAQFGFQFLWLAVATFPMMAVVQEMCARIGMATGRGLASNIRRVFPKPALLVLTFLLAFANTINIGADLGAMSKATQLVVPALPFFPLVVAFALFSLGLQIFVSYRLYAKYLKWLSFILVVYILTAFVIPNLDWRAIGAALAHPQFGFTRDALLIATAVLGTTISPYLFFWQTSQEVEEEVNEGRTQVQQRENATKKEIRRMRIDVWSGMFFSNLVMFFIILVCAATLASHGSFTIRTAADAAEALRPFAGQFAFLLFAFGIIGTGLLAVPILAGSVAYALSESFGWREGLFHTLRQARAFYGIIILAVGIGLAINALHLDPFRVLIGTAVINGLVAPIMLVAIVLLSGNRKLMGKAVNDAGTNVLGWLITGVMGVVAVLTIATMF